MRICIIMLSLLYWALPSSIAQKNVIDEVVWMVGDEPILRSDIEATKRFLLSSGRPLEGDADCYIPEQIAVQKLFLNQAKIDSIEVNEADVNRYVDMYLADYIQQFGSKEKMEEYFNRKYTQIREEQCVEVRNGEIVRMMRRKIDENVKVTPSEIRQYFASLPQDSLPYIPTTVEVQLLTIKPVISLHETDAIKKRLREFSDEINEGRRDFTTLARLYSEDSKTSLQGGEYGFVSKASLDAEFARVAFSLTDTKRVSPIIKTDDGYHIVQLIEKRGDVINFRQIVLKPKVSDAALTETTNKLDSLYSLIKENKLTFEKAVAQYSEDNDTRNNQGLMVNKIQQSDFYSSSRFKYEELPQDISRVVYNMKPGEVSKPFILKTDKGNEEVVIVKVKNLIEGHRANMNSDFQTIKALALNKKKEGVIDAWIKKKQKETYIHIEPAYRNCQFRYPGWLEDRQ